MKPTLPKSSFVYKGRKPAIHLPTKGGAKAKPLIQTGFHTDGKRTAKNPKSRNLNNVTAGNVRGNARKYNN